MDFLDQIDWANDDGVCLPMINDLPRNQFYNKILSESVKDQYCTDIGFGTGLLSVLALKHGAKHIRAFESDINRYQLGVEVINQLSLNNKIDLINERYTYDKYETTPVTFTETVSANIWGEGIWYSLPYTKDNKIFLPSNYFLEIWAVEISETFAVELLGTKNNYDLIETFIGPSRKVFCPGVDVDNNFVNLINKFMNVDKKFNTGLPNGILNFDIDQETIWGWHPHLKIIQQGDIVGLYSVGKHDTERNEFEILVSTKKWEDKIVLIVPRSGMSYKENKLYLDSGVLGPTRDPILLNKPEKDLIVKHNVLDSKITYQIGQ